MSGWSRFLSDRRKQKIAVGPSSKIERLPIKYLNISPNRGKPLARLLIVFTPSTRQVRRVA